MDSSDEVTWTDVYVWYFHLSGASPHPNVDVSDLSGAVPHLSGAVPQLNGASEHYWLIPWGCGEAGLQ